MYCSFDLSESTSPNLYSHLEVFQVQRLLVWTLCPSLLNERPEVSQLLGVSSINRSYLRFNDSQTLSLSWVFDCCRSSWCLSWVLNLISLSRLQFKSVFMGSVSGYVLWSMKLILARWSFKSLSLNVWCHNFSSSIWVTSCLLRCFQSSSFMKIHRCGRSSSCSGRSWVWSLIKNASV